ncbi:MAG: hypothetical protein JNL01_16675 [Bdellovibrionales bacterium]|nr:hypothetical protein [Bdellovibrionales bacterium]
MKPLVRTFALFLAFSATAFAGPAIPVEVLQKYTQENDMMPFEGKWSGQKVENKLRRSLMLLSAGDKVKLGIPEDQLAVANMRHQGNFYIAILRGAKVDQNGRPVSMNSQIEKIGLAQKHWAAKSRPETQNLEVHTEVLFYFKDGGGFELVGNQDAGTMLSKTKLVKTAVFSIEAARSSLEPETPFFPSAVGKNFALAHRMYSIQDRSKQHEGDHDRRLTYDTLDFSKTRSRIPGISSATEALLFNAIQTVDRRGRKEPYDIMTNNCTNNVFTLLDSSLEYPGFITEELKNDVAYFMKKDVKDILPFLQRAIEQKMGAEYTAFKGWVDVHLGAINGLPVPEIDFSRVVNQEVYMISVPAFTDGHLRARGLLPRSPCSPSLSKS